MVCLKQGVWATLWEQAAGGGLLSGFRGRFLASGCALFFNLAVSVVDQCGFIPNFLMFPFGDSNEELSRKLQVLFASLLCSIPV